MKPSMESRRLLLILQCGTEQRNKSKAKTGSPCHSSCATSWVQELSDLLNTYCNSENTQPYRAPVGNWS